MEKRPADGRQADATCGESWSFAAATRAAVRPSSPSKACYL